MMTRTTWLASIWSMESDPWPPGQSTNEEEELEAEEEEAAEEEASDE